MKEISVFEPTFLTQFKCVGGACKDHCCKEWNIILDKSTVNRYLKSKNKLIQSVAEREIISTKKNYSNWGLIDVSNGKSCAFMDDNRLCNIHQILGEEALSPTCATYPRTQKIYQFQINKSLTLSCPEAVRQLISDPDAMLLNESVILRPQALKAEKLDQGWQLVNLMCTNIINSSGIDIDQGLYGIALLFFYFEKLEFDIKRYEKLESYFYEIINSIQDGRLQKNLSEIKPDYKLQWALLARIQGYFGSRPPSRGTTAFNQFINKLSRIHVDGLRENDFRKSLGRINLAWNEKVMPWLSAHPHIMVNYLNYRIYNDSFPHNQSLSPLNNLYLLTAEWFFLKSILAASAALNGKIDEDDVITIIYSYHSITKHDLTSTTAFRELIQNTKVNDDLSLIYLLR